MGQRLTPADVRRLIARTVLGDSLDAPMQLGSIALRPHQVAAARRVKALLRRHGGAMLADPAGMGKTYTALAVAADAPSVAVVAPASLRAMWYDALRAASRPARVVSHEALSRGERPEIDASLLVVDEAHRFRNAAAKRYAALADLCRSARVLLLSATPIQNARRDLAAQLALFVGRRAWRMSEDELAAFVVRDALHPTTDLPMQAGPFAVTLSADDDCLDEILSLPPPVPARGESIAASLLTFGLVHQWSSSRAALVEALKRRRAHALALLDSLAAGRLPSRAELSAWTHLGDAMQLAFPEIASSAPAFDDDIARLRSAVEGHLAGIDRVRAALRATPDTDDARAAALRGIREHHHGERVIAFCHYTETVAALWSRLRHDPGVAALTASGARVAGGRLRRAEALAQFQPSTGRVVSAAARIDLLLATDVLSEGLNLQEASVVVHLDLPWNPARLEQRVGRVRRLGSRHPIVTVYALSPPAAAERLLRLDARLREKLRVARRTVGIAGVILPVSERGSMTDGAAERRGAVYQRLRGWLGAPSDSVPNDVPCVAAVRSMIPGFIALVSGDPPTLVARVRGAATDDPTVVLEALRLAESPPDAVDDDSSNAARREMERWLMHHRAAHAVDLSTAAAARARQAALARVSRALARAPRHERALLAPLAAAARSVAAAPLGEGAERVLAMLVEADLPDESWLRSIVAFGAVNVRREALPTKETGRIMAMLLFQAPGGDRDATT